MFNFQSAENQDKWLTSITNLRHITHRARTCSHEVDDESLFVSLNPYAIIAVWFPCLYVGHNRSYFAALVWVRSIAISVFVCLSACISCQNVTTVSIRVAVTRSYCGGNAIYVMYFRFMDGIMFSHNAANGPESKTTRIHFDEFDRWRYWGEVCRLRLHLATGPPNVPVMFCSLAFVVVCRRLSSSSVASVTLQVAGGPAAGHVGDRPPPGRVHGRWAADTARQVSTVTSR